MCVCAVPYSAGHKVLWRNLDLAQLFCTYELIAASQLDQYISTYGYPIIYY